MLHAVNCSLHFVLWTPEGACNLDAVQDASVLTAFCLFFSAAAAAAAAAAAGGTRFVTICAQ